MKNVINFLLALALLAVIAYGGYLAYEYAVQDATRRIKQGASEGVSEGISRGIGSVVNPVNLVKNIFGSGR